MNHKTMTRCALALAAALMAPAAMANFTTSVSGVTGPVGGNTSAITVRFTGNGTTIDSQVDYIYADNATAPVPTVTALNGWGCVTTVAPAGQRIIRVNSPGTGVIPSTPQDACTVTFAIPAGAASPQYPVTVRPATASDPAPASPIICSPAPTTACTATNFTVGIAAGVYQSTPAPGAAVLITDVVGGGATNATLAVTNGAAAGGPSLTLSAISGLSGVLGITPAAPQTIAAGATTNFTISCAATSATDTVQTLTITHNGGAPGAASPVTHQVTCRGITGPVAPTAALGTVTNPATGPINTTGSGTVVVNVLTAGNSVTAGDASLALNCTVPAGSASFAITGGGTRTITAPATVGANNPPIGFSCVRQATAQNATISCAQTPTPTATLPALTAQVTCPAGTTAPNPGVTPATGTAFNFVGGPSTALSGSITFTNTGGTASWVVDSCTFSPSVAGYTVTGTYPLTIAAGGSQAISVGCTTPATPGTALANTTLTCAGANAQFTASYPVTCRAEQVVPVPTMSASGKAMMAMLVLLVGLVGFQLYRRNV